MGCHVARGARLAAVNGVKMVKNLYFLWKNATFLFAVLPDAFDNELIMQTLRQILQGKTVQIPVYDFVTHSR